MTIGAFRLNTISAVLTDTSYVFGSGGTVSYFTSGSQFYKLHTFVTPGTNTFTLNNLSSVGYNTFELLLVGGGGAGGGCGVTPGAGGGGAGGQVYYSTSSALTPQEYTVVVGAGGTGVSAGTGGSGANSTGFGLTALGGGGGTLNSAATNGGGSGTNSSTSFTSTAGTYPFKGGNSFGSATATSRSSGGGATSGIGSYTQQGTSGQSGSAGGSGGGGQYPTNTGIDNGLTYYGSSGGGSGSQYAGAAYNNQNNTVLGAGTGSGRTTSGAGFSNTTVYGGGGGGAYAAGSTSQPGGNGNSGLAIVKYVAAPSTLTMAYISRTTQSGSGASLTVPTIAAGDLLIYFATAANGSGAVTEVKPSGFTTISTVAVNTTAGLRSSVYYKFAVGTETGTTITNMTGSSRSDSTLLVYRPSQSISAFTIGTQYGTVGVLAQATDGTPTSQNNNVNTNNPVTQLCFSYYSAFLLSGGISVRGSTYTATREFNIGTGDYIKTFEFNPSTILSSNENTISMADYGTNALTSFTFYIG
jgi:hypothetical protein